MKIVTRRALNFVGALFVSACSIAASAGNISIVAAADSVDMVMGDLNKIKVEVTIPTSLTGSAQLIDFPILTPGVEFIPFHGVDVVASDSSSVIKGDNTIYNFDFTIQAFDPETITLPPFSVLGATGADTIKSNTVTFKVSAVDVDSLDTINPMASIVAPASRWYDYIPDWLFWLVGAMALCALLVYLWILLRKRNIEIQELKKAPTPPYELALQRLATLKNKNLGSTGQEKEYYTELVDILRQYLDGRFGINAMEMTSTQIVKALRSNPKTKMTADEIRSILTVADFVKFAKVRPLPDDNIKAFNRAQNFVEQTKPEPEPTPENTETAKGADSKKQQ